MRLRIPISAVILGLTLWTAMYGQRSFRQYLEHEDNPIRVPSDFQEKTEFAFARLQFPSWVDGRYRGPGPWAIDYPKADRQFVQGLRRLTRIHTRSVEQVVDFADDDIYNWPWIYAVEVGYWNLGPAEAAKLRDYLLRGGFLMIDDFHGTMGWEYFNSSMVRVFPDRPIVDIPNKDAIFHVLYDLDERFQVPGIRMFETGLTYEYDGVAPQWKGIYDDRGRIMAAICHNMDLGDAWEWADDPQYPERYASLAYRIGVNYIVYAMTH
jgi:hypothetical protein